jgi:PAS domain S-box-containing protein
MGTSRKPDTLGLTLRYLFALGLVALLSIANYRLLRAEIRANESTVELLTLSGTQRTLLQATALLAQASVSIFSPEERAPLIAELSTAIEQLEKAHYRLVEFDPIGIGKPLPEVQKIYDDSPWLLDIEIRNYLAQLRALAGSEPDQMNLVNPHYRYIRKVALEGQVMNGLQAVVDVYQEESRRRAVLLRQQAISSLTSTLLVLVLSGLFVFRPMVKRVQQEMVALKNINETLEERVAERTAEAEDRARDLATSEALYQSLVETLPLGVARKDLAGRYTYVNQLFAELLGKSKDEILGGVTADIFSKEYARQSAVEDSNVIETGRIVQGVRDNPTPEGAMRTFEIVKSPVRDPQGKIMGTQTVLWDITKRRAAEERMLRAERLAAIGEMITGVAHESRNALQQINACAKMLEWEQQISVEAQELIADIQAAHHRLHRLFENLRGYASPQRMEIRPAYVIDIFHEAWRSTAPERQQRDISVQHLGLLQGTRCLVDPFQLEQVFRNILENAIVACTDPAQITVNWSETVWKGMPALQVVISDNGPGLTSEARERILEPFFTTRTRGTGLGMAIAKRIVEAHQGEITAANAPAGGTQITITLPRGTDES